MADNRESSPVPSPYAALGFDYEVGGGGCVYLTRYGTNGAYIMATCSDGGGMPEAGDYWLGIYPPESDGECALLIRNEDCDGGIGLALAAAVAAADSLPNSETEARLGRMRSGTLSADDARALLADDAKAPPPMPGPCRASGDHHRPRWRGGRCALHPPHRHRSRRLRRLRRRALIIIRRSSGKAKGIPMTIQIIKLDGAPVGIVDDEGNGVAVVAWFNGNVLACSMSHAIEHEGYSVAEGEPDCRDVESLIAGIAGRLSVTMESAFVPFSQSRNAKRGGADGKPWRSLNWLCTFARHGRTFLTTDYGQGVAHAPASKRAKPGDIRGTTEAAIALEIETGKIANVARWDSYQPRAGTKPVPAPPLGDVLQSLALDSSVLDSGTFEDWASDLGYSTDSRAAESIYRECVAHALALRSALGESGLAEIRLAASFN